MGAADNAHVVLSTVECGVSSKYVVGRDLFKFNSPTTRLAYGLFLPRYPLWLAQRIEDRIRPLCV